MRYYGDVYRPPSEADSLIIQATLGCSNNTCAFCTMYKNKSFVLRPMEDILADIREIAASKYCDKVRKVFIADGDALIMKTADLITIIRELKKSYPALRSITSYASPGNLLHKSIDELSTLKAEGLDMVYLGLESGSNEVLSLMTKGFSPEEIVEGGIKARNAGLKLSVSAIAGLGGVKYSEEHAIGTAKALSLMKPEYAALLTLEVNEGTPLAKWVDEGSFTVLNSSEILNETKKLISALELDNTVFRMNHASNYLSLKGTLNKDKEALIADIDNALRGVTALRPEWMRGF